MPIFVFACDNCGAEIELLVPANKQSVACLDCEQPMSRLVSAPNVHFSGSGFTRSSIGARTR